MTNKEAIETLKDEISGLPADNPFFQCVNLAIKALEERLPGEWIPVSERLPEEMQKVLIWFEYLKYGDFVSMHQTYGFGYICDGKWSPFINGETGWTGYNVVAWQPLPEPYKKGEEKMGKEATINLFLELADSFKKICYDIDADECRTEKCPFAKKDKYGNFVCIFEEKGMDSPYNWQGEKE